MKPSRGLPPLPILRNIRTIAEIEAKNQHIRGQLDRASDYVARFAGSPVFVLFHLVWFGIWITVNSASDQPFDPYPFTFLTFLVSLEAIVLTSFVLTSQRHAERQGQQRAALDLQINLLAEEEMTAVLRKVTAIAEHLGIPEVRHPDDDALTTQTDVVAVANAVDVASAEPTSPSASTNTKR